MRPGYTGSAVVDTKQQTLRTVAGGADYVPDREPGLVLPTPQRTHLGDEFKGANIQHSVRRVTRGGLGIAMGSSSWLHTQVPPKPQAKKVKARWGRPEARVSPHRREAIAARESTPSGASSQVRTFFYGGAGGTRTHGRRIVSLWDLGGPWRSVIRIDVSPGQDGCKCFTLSYPCKSFPVLAPKPCPNPSHPPAARQPV